MTETKNKPIKVDKQLLKGKWEISKHISNTNGTKAFGGHMLTAYIHPLTSKMTHLLNADNQPKTGYFLERKSQILRPEENPEDALALEWLLAHPEVVIKGATIPELLSAKKKHNSSITLRNLDNIEMNSLDDDDQVDRVIGRLSLEAGPQAIGLTRLRYLLAYFNLSYFEKRYVSEPKTEKKFLRTTMKKFCRRKNTNGVFNAVEVEAVLDEIDNFEINYLVKEMMRHGIVVLTNNIFKYNNVPLGSTMESTINWFRTNANIYAEAQSKLLPLLKEEGFKTVSKSD